MAKEPIMIDDVDVSKCGFYCSAEENNYNCMLLNNIKNDCSYYKICYYKQLKRKEQECEQWKHQAELGVDTTNILTKELEEKEQECEELKKSVRSNKDKRKRAIEKYRRLKEFTNKNFNQFEIDMEKAENERFKKALQEIKEIAENAYCLTNGTNKDMAQFAKQILQKCEVIKD